jgi:hypothetical protein
MIGRKINVDLDTRKMRYVRCEGYETMRCDVLYSVVTDDDGPMAMRRSKVAMEIA